MITQRVVREQVLHERPLHEALQLDDGPAEPATTDEALARLQRVFRGARAESNAYVGERLDELYELTERAVTLGASLPPPVPEDRPAPVRLVKALPKLAARFGSGLLLAAMAPLVYADSLALSVLAGVTAVVTLATGREKPKRRTVIRPRGGRERLGSLASAADKALASMTAQRALPAPKASANGFGDEDVLSFLQEALVLDGNEAAEEAAANAERLIRRAGYRVIRTPKGNEELFEKMIDPGMTGELLLRPALVHETDSSRTHSGVIVQGRAR